ncbi:MAG: homoserine kinase [Myxococcaceae bacterium]
MAVYTQLSHDVLAHAAQSFGLGALNGAVGIPQGSINTNYRLETDAGRFFLRHTTVRDADALRFESALLDHLSASHFPAPRQRRTAAGASFLELSGGRVSVFGFLAGEELKRTQFTADHALRLGAELGKMHRLTQQFSNTRANPYDLDCVSAWHQALRGQSDAEVAEAVRVLEGALSLGKGDSMLPRGAIHADLFMDNVKWLGDRVSAFFDFEMACIDTYALDLAITLNAWCFDGGYQPHLCRAFVSGYQCERRLMESERTGLFVQTVFGACRYTLSRIRDFHLSPLPPDRLVKKDFRTYLSRVKALREMGPDRFEALLFS